MNASAVAALCAGLLLAGWQSEVSSPAAAGERVEAGHFRSAGGNEESYRIRLLPVSSFPELPREVAARLEQMHCMIPQTFEAQQPENVIQGAFHAAGSREWAALCSVDGKTTLYVFFAGQYDAPEALRSQADTVWLGAEPGSSVYGSAWGISVRHAGELRGSRSLHFTGNVEHDGIEDAHVEHSATVHYWQAGEWQTLSDHD